MTVPSETNKSGPYYGNGVTVDFDYDFRIVDENHLRVALTDADGVETVLTITSDYTVDGVGAAGGGSITLTVPPATGELLTITRNVPFTQETDLENQGAYYAETVEDALDLAAMRDQQLAEEVSRAVKIGVSVDPSGLDQLVSDITRLSQSADEIDTVADNIESVNDVANNMPNVNTVSGIANEISEIADEVNEAAGSAAASAAAAAASAEEAAQHVEGVTPTVMRFSGDDVETEFDLEIETLDERLTNVYIDGVYQQKDTYEVVDGVLTFDTPPPAGTDNIEVNIGGTTAQAFAIPSNGTVTPLKTAWVFETVSSVQGRNVPTSVSEIEVLSYASSGDGGGARYKRVMSEPSHAGKIQSADGAWWEIAEAVLRPEQFGADPSSDDNTDALNTWASCCVAMGKSAFSDPLEVYTVRGLVTLPTLFTHEGSLNLTTPLNTGVSIDIKEGVSLGSLRFIHTGDDVSDARIDAARYFTCDSIYVEAAVESNNHMFVLRPTGAKIGRFESLRYGRPIVLSSRGVEGIDEGGEIGEIYIDTYLRGIAIQGCNGWKIDKITMRNRAAEAARLPGHNGILMSGASNWRIGVLDISDTGEHAVRFGESDPGTEHSNWYIGTLIASNIGGSAFKIYDKAQVSRNGRIDIVKCLNIGNSSVASWIPNRECVRFTNCDGHSIGSIVGRRTSDNDGSCTYGLHINACRNINVETLDIMDAREGAVLIDDMLDVEWAGAPTSNITIGELISSGSTPAVLTVRAERNTVGNINILSGKISGSYTSLVLINSVTTSWTGPIFFSAYIAGGFTFNGAAVTAAPIVGDFEFSDGGSMRGVLSSFNRRGTVTQDVAPIAIGNTGAYGGTTIRSVPQTPAPGLVGVGTNVNRPGSSRRGGTIAIRQITSNNYDVAWSFYTSLGTSATDAVERRFDVSRLGVLSTVIMGYDVGTGVAVTQATSKGTAVTANGLCGSITTAANELASGASVVFEVTNSRLTSILDIVNVNVVSPSDKYVVAIVGRASATTFRVRLTNITNGPLSEAVVIGFNVMRSSAT